MKALTTLTDPVYVEPKKFSSYEKFWLRFLNDKRDLPFIHLLTAIHILVIPVAILLYTPVSARLVLVAGLYSLFLCFADVF